MLITDYSLGTWSRDASLVSASFRFSSFSYFWPSQLTLLIIKISLARALIFEVGIKNWTDLIEGKGDTKNNLDVFGSWAWCTMSRSCLDWLHQKELKLFFCQRHGFQIQLTDFSTHRFLFTMTWAFRLLTCQSGALILILKHTKFWALKWRLRTEIGT